MINVINRKEVINESYKYLRYNLRGTDSFLYCPFNCVVQIKWYNYRYEQKIANPRNGTGKKCRWFTSLSCI